ncbi:hypothetical protein [Cellulophaga sp. Z1A5H]|uniref:hypothetical protein n=1 Tax=Cellulophaga sp. Z1A5H TaxID=2687291 RepID=UPI0013FD9A5A|nr:hypothetical protein [Cellulophaga sp. Z1A5H]
MRKLIFLVLIGIFSATGYSQTKRANEKIIESAKSDSQNNSYKDIKSLFRWSPLSIFDETTEGLESSEKEELLKKGESAYWKIMEATNTKLVINHIHNGDRVTLRFFKHKDSLDGVLFAEVENGANTSLSSWNYDEESETLQKSNLLHKYTANDFVSKEDKLPDSYHAVVHYSFIDELTIQVSLYTWMEKEFENRKISNELFLKWNGENFVEKIERIEQ